jgi:integrase
VDTEQKPQDQNRADHLARIVGIFVGIPKRSERAMLTDTECKNAKFDGAPKKISDSGGLYLLVTKTAKLWQMAYRFRGKQKTASFGEYHSDAKKGVTLAAARIERDAAKKLLKADIDPGQKKKEAKRPQTARPTFRFIAKEWYDTKVVGEGLGDSTQESTLRRIALLNATLGEMEASQIEPADVLRAISDLQKRKKHCEAARTRGVASRIFCFGVPYGYCVRDPAADLSAAMTSETANTKPRPALTNPEAFGGLLRDIQKYRGWHGNIVGLALQLLPLVVTRPYKEFCLAEWTEFNFDKALWTIPQERMKERDGEHLVPLSRQAIQILRWLQRRTGNRRFVFSLGDDEPITENAINMALKAMGYSTKTQQCGHGFRRSFSTMVNKEFREDGTKVWHNDVIELQLAHHEKSTRAIYNETGPESLLQQRRLLLQHWADRCDIMREGSNVVPMVKPEREAVPVRPKRRRVA